MQTVLHAKIDADLKRKAQDVAEAVGLPLSTVIAAGLREFVRTRSITISDLPSLKPEVEAELVQLEKDVRKRKDVSPRFGSLSSAKKWLESDD